MRTNVYVGGFNLYFGAVRGTPYKWLNLVELAQGLLKPDHEINRLRYFTARITASSGDPSRPERQSTFLRALSTLPEVEIHYGMFRSWPRDRLRVDGGGLVKVWETEEKGSDANLATYLVLDACSGDYEAALVISNDTDLLTPITEVRSRFAVKVGIACPVYPRNRHPARELVGATDFSAHIDEKRKKLLRESQFPDVMTDAQGPFHKPAGW